MSYSQIQWVESFEGQMSILRPHMTGRLLATVSARRGFDRRQPLVGQVLRERRHSMWKSSTLGPLPPPFRNSTRLIRYVVDSLRAAFGDSCAPTKMSAR
jgi:hypothetical protein